MLIAPDFVLQELGQVILETIPEYLDHSFDRDAWADCYAVIADGISK